MKKTMILALAVGLLACDLPQQNTNKVPAYESAKKYLDALKIPYNGVSCTEVDTDRDGYVTCTVSEPSPSDPTKQNLMSIQCAAIGGNAGGCKPTPNAKQ